MENFKVMLKNRIEEILDEGLSKHIPLTSDFLADKLLTESTSNAREMQYIERLLIATLIQKKFLFVKDMQQNKPQSYLSPETGEQSAALELAADMLLDPVKHLTPDELFSAYCKQQHIFDMLDIMNELGMSADDYIEEFGIDQNPVTSEEIDQMANELRHLMNNDDSDDWQYCRQEVITKILRRRVLNA